MKGLLLLLLCLMVCLFSLGVNTETFEITEAELNMEFVANKFADLLVHRIFEKRQEQLGIIPEKDARIPLLPGGEITIPFIDSRLNFTSNLLIDGFYEHYDSALVLDTIQDDDLRVDLNGTFIDIGYTIGLNLALRGNYNTNFNLNFTYLDEVIPGFPIDVPDEGLIVLIEGKGGYEIALNNLTLSVEIALEVVDSTVKSAKAFIHALSLGKLGIQFDNFMFNGFEGDILLELLNSILNGLLPSISLLQPILEAGLDGFLAGLEGCVLPEMIDGDLSCLGLPTGTPGPTTAKPTPPYVEDGSSTLASSWLLLFAAIAALFHRRH